MYIEPNGICHVLTGVPLDNTYVNTLWFDLDNKRSQYDYFITKKKHTLTGQTYTRYSEGIMAVGLPADSLYECNYIMFQNSGYGNKWFYAFINKVEYVNNATSYIYFQLDVMQTWHFDYTPKQCFIEREHSVTDRIGENLVTENLEHGDYITLRKFGFIDYYIDEYTSIGIYCTGLPVELRGAESEFTRLKIHHPDFFGGVPTPCYLLEIDVSAPLSEIEKQDVLQTLELISLAFSGDKEGNVIVSAFTYPKSLISNVGVKRTTITLFNEEQYGAVSNRIDGTQPKNNKLKTFPYSCYTVQTPLGCTELKYELSTVGVPQYEILGALNVGGKVVGYPLSYAGELKNISHCLSLGGFPLCAWKTDGFSQWFAQNNSRLVASYDAAGRNKNMGMLKSAIGGSLGAGASAATGNVMGAISSGSSGMLGTVDAIVQYQNQVEQMLATITDARATPDSLQGSVNGVDGLVASGQNDFYFYAKSIRPEFVTIIDDYFTKYGYATHKVKTPNRNSRPHFNYIKTLGATITGSVPTDDMRVICSIYNNGITFWKNGDNVGNYGLDNRPQ